MSKTVEEIGLIVGGIALATVGILAGPAGVISLQGSATMFNAMIGMGVTTALTGVGIALRSNTLAVGAPNTLNLSNGPQPRRVIYGQFQTAGVLTYASFAPSQNQSTTNQYLHLVYALTGHEISSFDAIVIDGSIYNFGTDLVYDPGGTDTLWHVHTPPASDFYQEHMFFEFDFGRPSNTAQPFPSLDGADSTWTSACLQRGCAKVHVICRYDSGWTAVFPSGQIPNIQFLVTGKKLVDPRIITAWQPSTSYPEFSYVVENDLFGVPQIWVQTNASGVSGTSEPTFGLASSYPTFKTDNTCSWQAVGTSQSGASAGRDSNPQGHLVNGRLVNDAWAPGIFWAGAELIEAPLGYLQRCTTSGTGGASEPAFGKTLGSTTSDGSAVWTCCGRSWNAINPSNSALIVNDYLQNDDWGMDVDLSTIDSSATIAAANICEEQALIIWNSDGSIVYEDQYSCNGMFDFSSTRGDVLTSLCASMAGWCVPPGDLWRIFAGSFQTPTISLGDSDMRGAIKGDFRLSVREVLNTVGADFVPAFLPTNPGGATSLTQVPPTWQARPAPEYQANGLAGKPDYLNSEDGGQILRTKLQLDFTTSMWAAQRLEKIALMRTRFQQTVTLPAKTIAMQLEAADTFSFTHARWGIEDGSFETTQNGVTWEAEGASAGDAPVVGIDLIGRQTDPSVYEFQGPTSPTDFGEYSPYGITGVMTGVE